AFCRGARRQETLSRGLTERGQPPAGIKETNFEKLVAHKPEEIFERAVKGMLPKGPLGYAMIKKMKVYAGSEHPHAAQQPQVLDI
ncbi:uL13 family ribosomal protein, partial [Klebsiella pneumoniae]